MSKIRIVLSLIKAGQTIINLPELNIFSYLLFTEK